MNIHLDPNESFKKKIGIYVSIIIITLPFLFIFIKHEFKHENNDNVKQNKNTEQLLPYKKRELSINLSKEDKKDFIKIDFSDVRSIKVSNNKKRLFILGHDRSGISIIDIKNKDNMKLLDTLFFPNIKKNYVNEIDIVESKDGKNLYVVSPNIGLYCISVSNQGKMNVRDIVKIKGAYKITLSMNETKAYIGTNKGVSIINLKERSPSVVGTYISKDGLSKEIVSTYDLQVLSERYLLLLNSNGLNLFDIKNDKNITFIQRISTLGRGKEIIIAPNKLRLYVVTNSNYVETFDISILNNIRLLGGYSTKEEYLFGVKVTNDGSKLLVGNKRYGNDISLNLDIVDMSYSIDPKMIKQFEINIPYFSAFGISTDEKYLFITLSIENKNYIVKKRVNLER